MNKLLDDKFTILFSFNPLLIGAEAPPMRSMDADTALRVHVSIPFSSGRRRLHSYEPGFGRVDCYVSIPFSSGRRRLH